ncbi:metallophosphoesterase [Hydrogenophaga sp.]|uniref:metallophosphoesterase family protein n=1 Tax=Hydrogenophaga sp. TaxID=1904254 RepID=UPI0025BCFAC7|nr:metallophosphoesterase [Hydrogenophaga sp.]
MNRPANYGKAAPLRDMAAFDQENASAMRKLWFLGDVHGEFRHIGVALRQAEQAGNLPSWLISLGDVELDTILREILAPLRLEFPGVKVAFIHGNHDADTHENWACLHDCADAVALHGQVVELVGIRVAGLGGNFMGRVWAPPSGPTFASKAQAMKRGPYAWRDGQQPSPKLHGAIYRDDVAALAKQRADILVTHEAPSCHPYGWETLDQLARDMRVVRTFHGHTHDDLSEQYAMQRDQLGFDARAVNFCCIKNGLGEFISGPPPEKASWS